MTDPRRGLPSVDRLLQLDTLAPVLAKHPRQVVVAAIRDMLDVIRTGRAAPPDDWAAAIAERAAAHTASSLRRVINATGVVIHTNLGRAPLADAALEAVREVASGFSTLEFDLASGARGSRQDHCRTLLAEQTGADDALVVNNAAGALVLALNALAEGREVMLSRGELIEIGGSFRIPDILARSGARLREVGTTNRTHLRDYAEAIGPDTGAILVVHRSNFEQRGFTASPAPGELATIAGQHGIPFVHDVGSGLLMDLSPWGLTSEPRVTDAIHEGAGLVLFSGDKLLGGPQAGCLVGAAPLIARCARNPLARALRADKMTLAALEATLNLYRDPERARLEIPVLRMLTSTPAALRTRAESLMALLGTVPGLPAAPHLEPGHSTPGGGSFPGAELATTLVVLDPGTLGADGLALRLRLAETPVVARIHDGRVVLDPRTIQDAEFPAVAAALGSAFEGDG
ncbi:MAG TPA: L-seryl-tRNA(Sec) selenium transferase [Gemmatimonadales bacterium]|nr:L-seryl-tRNA(Sec) selenium transferase [Gemmatimonadales bacterium]